MECALSVVWRPLPGEKILCGTGLGDSLYIATDKMRIKLLHLRSVVSCSGVSERVNDESERRTSRTIAVTEKNITSIDRASITALPGEGGGHVLFRSTTSVEVFDGKLGTRYHIDGISSPQINFGAGFDRARGPSYLYVCLEKEVKFFKLTARDKYTRVLTRLLPPGPLVDCVWVESSFWFVCKDKDSGFFYVYMMSLHSIKYKKVNRNWPLSSVGQLLLRDASEIVFVAVPVDSSSATVFRFSALDGFSKYSRAGTNIMLPAEPAYATFLNWSNLICALHGDDGKKAFVSVVDLDSNHVDHLSTENIFGCKAISAGTSETFYVFFENEIREGNSFLTVDDEAVCPSDPVAAAIITAASPLSIVAHAPVAVDASVDHLVNPISNGALSVSGEVIGVPSPLGQRSGKFIRVDLSCVCLFAGNAEDIYCSAVLIDPSNIEMPRLCEEYRFVVKPTENGANWPLAWPGDGQRNAWGQSQCPSFTVNIGEYGGPVVLLIRGYHSVRKARSSLIYMPALDAPQVFLSKSFFDGDNKNCHLLQPLFWGSAQLSGEPILHKTVGASMATNPERNSEWGGTQRLSLDRLWGLNDHARGIKDLCQVMVSGVGPDSLNVRGTVHVVVDKREGIEADGTSQTLARFWSCIGDDTLEKSRMYIYPTSLAKSLDDSSKLDNIVLEFETGHSVNWDRAKEDVGASSGQMLSGWGTCRDGAIFSTLNRQRASPIWEDEICVILPEGVNSHVVRPPFSIWLRVFHVKAGSSGEKKLIGYSKLPLVSQHGRLLEDGGHDLLIYKDLAFSKPTKHSLFLQTKLLYCDQEHINCVPLWGMYKAIKNEMTSDGGKLYVLMSTLSKLPRESLHCTLLDSLRLLYRMLQIPAVAQVAFDTMTIVLTRCLHESEVWRARDVTYFQKVLQNEMSNLSDSDKFVTTVAPVWVKSCYQHLMQASKLTRELPVFRSWLVIAAGFGPLLSACPPPCEPVVRELLLALVQVSCSTGSHEGASRSVSYVQRALEFLLKHFVRSASGVSHTLDILRAHFILSRSTPGHYVSLVCAVMSNGRIWKLLNGAEGALSFGQAAGVANNSFCLLGSVVEDVLVGLQKAQDSVVDYLSLFCKQLQPILSSLQVDISLGITTPGEVLRVYFPIMKMLFKETFLSIVEVYPATGELLNSCFLNLLSLVAPTITEDLYVRQWGEIFKNNEGVSWWGNMKRIINSYDNDGVNCRSFRRGSLWTFDSSSELLRGPELEGGEGSFAFPSMCLLVVKTTLAILSRRGVLVEGGADECEDGSEGGCPPSQLRAQPRLVIHVLDMALCLLEIVVRRRTEHFAKDAICVFMTDYQEIMRVLSREISLFVSDRHERRSQEMRLRNLLMFVFSCGLYFDGVRDNVCHIWLHILYTLSECGCNNVAQITAGSAMSVLCEQSIDIDEISSLLSYLLLKQAEFSNTNTNDVESSASILELLTHLDAFVVEYRKLQDYHTMNQKAESMHVCAIRGGAANTNIKKMWLGKIIKMYGSSHPVEKALCLLDLAACYASDEAQVARKYRSEAVSSLIQGKCFGLCICALLCDMDELRTHALVNSALLLPLSRCAALLEDVSILQFEKAQPPVYYFCRFFDKESPDYNENGYIYRFGYGTKLEGAAEALSEELSKWSNDDSKSNSHWHDTLAVGDAPLSGFYLSPVKPVPSGRQHHHFIGADASLVPCKFSLDTPCLADGTFGQTDSITEQHTHRRVLTVKYPFPYVVQRQEVSHCEVTILSPVEVATERVHDKRMQLERDTLLLVNSLDMIVELDEKRSAILDATIDDCRKEVDKNCWGNLLSFVGGGPSIYLNAFFVESGGTNGSTQDLARALCHLVRATDVAVSALRKAWERKSEEALKGVGAEGGQEIQVKDTNSSYMKKLEEYEEQLAAFKVKMASVMDITESSFDVI